MSGKEPAVVDKRPQTVLVVGIALTTVVHSAVDCYQFQGNAAFVRHCQYGGKKALWISQYEFLGDRLNSEYLLPRNNVEMQKYNWLLSYHCTSLQVQAECFCVSFISDTLRTKKRP